MTIWRYEIQYGPEGEANYAWIYKGDDMIATMRTHHAIEVVQALSASPAGVKPLEAKRWLLEEHLPSGSIRWQCFEHEHHCQMVARASDHEVSITPLIDARIMSAIEPAGVGVETPPPSSHVAPSDTVTVAQHMKNFEAFVAATAPKLHWKVYQDLGADPTLSKGYYDGWQHGFGEEVLGPLPLPQLMETMKAAIRAALATTEGKDNG